MRKFLLSNPAKAFYWTTLNWLISLAILYFTDNNLEYSIVLIPILNTITKFINTQVLPNLK